MMLNPQDYVTAMSQLKQAQEHNEEAKLFRDEYRVLTALITSMINSAVSVGLEETDDIQVLNNTTMLFAKANKTPTKMAVLSAQEVEDFLEAFTNLSNDISQLRFGVSAEELADLLYDPEEDDNEEQ